MRDMAANADMASTTNSRLTDSIKSIVAWITSEAARGIMKWSQNQ